MSILRGFRNGRARANPYIYQLRRLMEISAFDFVILSSMDPVADRKVIQRFRLKLHDESGRVQERCDMPGVI